MLEPAPHLVVPVFLPTHHMPAEGAVICTQMPLPSCGEPALEASSPRSLDPLHNLSGHVHTHDLLSQQRNITTLFSEADITKLIYDRSVSISPDGLNFSVN